jgi:hypothetical protein
MPQGKRTDNGKDDGRDVPSAPGNGRRRIGATYRYTDESGTLLYEVVRYDPKDFRQRRPDGRGGWHWNLSGVRRVLYRLPELLAADPGRPVFLVEGEKDADNLAALCLVATTGAMGAGKWRSEYAEALRGRHVCILPDNDEPGRKHAADVARQLQGVAASVKILQLPDLPPKGDVSDWLAAGGSKQALLELALRGDTWEVPAGPEDPGDHTLAADRPVFPDPIPASHLAADGSTLDWLWRGYLARQSVTLLTSLWKSGKSTLLAHLVKAMGQGKDLAGLAVAAGNVLVISEESQQLWAGRRDKLAITDHALFYTRPFKGRPEWATWIAFVQHLAELTRARALALVCLDSLAALSPCDDENDAAQMQAALSPLHGISEAGAAVLLVHHPRKGDAGEGQASRGSGALPAFADIILEMRRSPSTGHNSRQRVLTAYSRFEETPDELVIELAEDGSGYRSLGARTEADRRARWEAIADALPAEGPGQTAEELRDQWPEPKPGKRTLEVDLKQGAEAGRWSMAGAGRKGDPFRFWRNQNSIRAPIDSIAARIESGGNGTGESPRIREPGEEG